MKIVDDPSIIESTFVKVSRASMPHRIVLREIKPNVGSNLKPEYVTHYENMQFENDSLVHHSFYNGNYFFDKAEALSDFIERAKKQGFG